MKSLLFWLLGALAAFFVTAGAFLFLAKFGAGLGQSDPIPQEPRAAAPGPALKLRFDESRLEDLETNAEQTILLYVENLGGKEISYADLVLSVSSDSTVRTREQNYRKRVKELGPKEMRSVELKVDLSPPIPAESGEPVAGDDSDLTRKILEARATTPEGPSAIQTVVLP